MAARVGDRRTVQRLHRLTPDCFHRSCQVGHITGSAWLVDIAGDRVLLAHHRKLGRWLQPGVAAEQGYAVGQFSLGWKYANGEGVPEDDAEAVR